MNRERSHPIPPLLLEQLALGELSAHKEREIRETLAAREGGLDWLEQELAAIQESNAAILAQLPPGPMARSLVRNAQAEEKAGAPLRRPRGLGLGAWLPRLAPAMALVVMALFVFRPGPDQVNTPAFPSIDDPSGDRSKGGMEPHLRIYRQARGGPESLRDGTKVGAGDVVQLSYVAAGWSHGTILSIDGHGTVTLHYPARANDSTVLERSGEVTLGHGYKLDDAPAFERFLFITADQPLEPWRLLEAARSLENPRSGLLPLDPGHKQHSFVLRKEQP